MSEVLSLNRETSLISSDMTQRELFKAEIDRMRNAMMQTSSFSLKTDYGKAIKRMQKELAIYDRYQKEARK